MNTTSCKLHVAAFGLGAGPGYASSEVPDAVAKAEVPRLNIIKGGSLTEFLAWAWTPALRVQRLALKSIEPLAKPMRLTTHVDSLHLDTWTPHGGESAGPGTNSSNSTGQSFATSSSGGRGATWRGQGREGDACRLKGHGLTSHLPVPTRSSCMLPLRSQVPTPIMDHYGCGFCWKMASVRSRIERPEPPPRPFEGVLAIAGRKANSKLSVFLRSLS